MHNAQTKFSHDFKDMLPQQLDATWAQAIQHYTHNDYPRMLKFEKLQHQLHAHEIELNLKLQS